MAKFCSECGRPLEEGEVCHCVEEGNVDRGNINMNQNNSVHDNQKNEADFQSNNREEKKETNLQIPNVNEDNNQNFQSGNSNGNYGQNFQSGNNYQNYGQNAQGQNNHQNHGQQTNSESEFSKKSKDFFGGVKRAMKMIVPILNHPIKEIKKIMNTDDKMGFYMIITHILAITIAAVIMEEGVFNRIFYARFFFHFDYSLLRFVISVIVFVGTIDFLLAAILLFTTKIIFNYDTTYNKMMTIVGGMAIVNAATIIAGACVSIIFGSLGTFIVLLGMAFSILVLIFAYSENVKLEPDQKVYALLISFALLVVVAANIVYFVF